MDAPAYAEGAVVERAQRLARTLPVESVAHTRSEPRNERAFDESLTIEHGIVAPAVQQCANILDLPPGLRGQDTLAPAAWVDTDHLRYGWMQSRQIGEV